MTTARVQYVTLDETLKLLKAELRREFPRTKFSITRSRGTGYGYVTVRWTDGPTVRAVSAITNGYEGQGFDGMTDSTYSIEHTAATGAGDPVRVQYGTKGIHTARHITPAREAAAIRNALRLMGDWAQPDRARALADDPDDRNVIGNACMIRPLNGYVDAAQLAHRALGGCMDESPTLAAAIMAGVPEGQP